MLPYDGVDLDYSLQGKTAILQVELPESDTQRQNSSIKKE